MEEIKNNNEDTIKWGGWLNEFLWICAGANRKVLRQCPTDYAKFAGIGGTILFTALMAMISGGYALYFVFNSVVKAIAFGIFWGLLIFNLDRFIVNTMYSDGKDTISRREFFSGLPRIIMAIFLGIVISTPLEMKIFEDRINSQLVKDNIERSNQVREVGNAGNSSNKESLKDFEAQRKELIAEKQRLDSERSAIDNELQKANRELMEEGEGTALSGRIGRGPIYREKEELRNRIENQLKSWDERHEADLERINASLATVNNQINNINNQINTNNNKIEEDAKNTTEENGFCVRYEAFSNVKKDNISLEIVSVIIMLLFIIIEIAPTFFKMMIASGPYDDYLRAEMHRVRVLSDKRISDLNDEINTEIQISTQKNKERLEAEVLANRKLMERISNAQADLLQTAIDKWKEQELAKINEDPSAYIKTNIDTNS